MMILKIDPNEVRWFAMSSPYCREMKAKELLDRHGIKNFIPMVRKQVVVDDELETKETPPSTTSSSCMTAIMASWR